MKKGFRLKAVQAGYGKRAVGPVCDLDLACGKLHAFIGPNGAGKSTIVRTMTGLQRPLSGSVHIGPDDVHALKPRERAQRVAFVASTPPVASGLTAGEVLGLMPGTEREHRAALVQMGEAGWWGVRLSELSDGQRQRVMLARAFLQQTPWIVLDEPTAFLDARTRTTLFEHLNDLAERGIGIVLTTHDLHLLNGQQQLGSVHAFGTELMPLETSGSVAEWEAAC